MGDLTSAPVPGPRAGDHARGPAAGPLVIAYADLACVRCAVLWTRLPGDVRLVLRHFALPGRHPRAVALAHAAEAAAAQGAFLAFVASVYADQGHIDDPHLWARCEALGLDLERFETDRRGQAARDRVSADVREALRAGITSTPTLYVAEDRSTAILAEIGFSAVRTTPGNDGRGRE